MWQLWPKRLLRILQHTSSLLSSKLSTCMIQSYNVPFSKVQWIWRQFMLFALKYLPWGSCQTEINRSYRPSKLDFRHGSGTYRKSWVLLGQFRKMEKQVGKNITSQYRFLAEHASVQITNETGGKNISWVLFDYETAIMHAMSEQFNARPRGCYFHYAKAFWRNVQKHHLQGLYGTSKIFRNYINEYLALAFLPARNIQEGVNDIDAFYQGHFQSEPRNVQQSINSFHIY